MTEEQVKLIEKTIDWKSCDQAWGVWDTAKECWVRGQRDMFYNDERSDKAGLSQRMVHSIKWNLKWRFIKRDESPEIYDEMVKEFRRQVKNRYVVKQLF